MKSILNIEPLILILVKSNLIIIYCLKVQAFYLLWLKQWAVYITLPENMINLTVYKTEQDIVYKTEQDL